MVMKWGYFMEIELTIWYKDVGVFQNRDSIGGVWREDIEHSDLAVFGVKQS